MHRCSRQWLASLALFAALASPHLTARQFDLVVYNVENLFDADGIALYADYQPGNLENPSPYGARKLLTKIQHIAAVLRGFNDGAGPEVILFQEFELDRSPLTTVNDYPAFLAQYQGTTVDEMLTSGFNEEVAGLPVEALVLKYFEDNGLSGYHVALPEPFTPWEDSPAHTNAVFTKFPLTYQKSHPTPSARMIQEVGIDVDGEELIVFNNHWKSGASSPGTEAKRVRNARDLRAAIDAVLAGNPQADIVVGGDLNTYYNAPSHFPREHPDQWAQVKEYAIAELGSQGNEDATRRGEAPLYNLWFELPEDRRGSELYHGYWGTLMQILVTPGLYDGQGVHYVDNSLRVLAVPGLNTCGPWNQPSAWHFTGPDGGGFSDHFPLVATFSTGEAPGYSFASSRDRDGPPKVPTVDYSRISITGVDEFDGLVNHEPATLSANMGDVFAVRGELVYKFPFIARIGDQHFELYTYDDDARKELAKLRVNRPVRFVGQLDEYHGKPQFVIHDANWIR